MKARKTTTTKSPGWSKQSKTSKAKGRRRATKNRAFIAACGHGDLEAAQRLWAQRDLFGDQAADESLAMADVQAIRNYALIHACTYGHLDVARWLWGLRHVTTGANLVFTPIAKDWALDMTYGSCNINPELVQWMLDLGWRSLELQEVVPIEGAVCPICQSRPKDAIVTAGHDKQHGACRACLEEWLDKNSTCPVCQEEL